MSSDFAIRHPKPGDNVIAHLADSCLIFASHYQPWLVSSLRFAENGKGHVVILTFLTTIFHEVKFDF
jgi:hypothetical protein